MFHKKLQGAFLAFFIVFLISGIAIAEDDDWVIKIAKIYEKTLVGIETTVKHQNGDKDNFGGSGFFISLDGKILTNNHVVKDDEDSKITENDSEKNELKKKYYSYWIIFEGKKYRAKLLGADKYQDLALLKVENPPEGIIPAKLGNSDNLQVGQKVIVYGNPLDLKNTLTSGRISALHRRTLFDGRVEDSIQTDAAINFGNSGGPLINEQGEVIGINYAITNNSNNLGFAIPINFAVRVLDRLEKGDIKIGWFGVKTKIEKFIFSGTFEDLKELYEIIDNDSTSTLVQTAKILENPGAALVEEVEKDSPAEEAGIEKGDLIVEFNHKKITDGYDLRTAIFESPTEEDLLVVLLKVDKNGKVETSRKMATLYTRNFLKEQKKAHH